MEYVSSTDILSKTIRVQDTQILERAVRALASSGWAEPLRDSESEPGGCKRERSWHCNPTARVTAAPRTLSCSISCLVKRLMGAGGLVEHRHSPRTWSSSQRTVSVPGLKASRETSAIVSFPKSDQMDSVRADHNAPNLGPPISQLCEMPTDILFSVRSSPLVLPASSHGYNPRSSVL